MKTKLFFTFFLIISLLMVVGCGTKEQSQEQRAEELVEDGAEDEVATEAGEEAAEVEMGEESVPAVMEEETVAEEVLNESTEVSSEEGTESTEEAALESEEASEAVAEETLEATYVVINVEGCTDTDGGMNYELAGSVTDVDSITDEDYCSANENYPGRLYETYCRESGKHGREQYDCQSKVCKLGACVSPTE